MAHVYDTLTENCKSSNVYSPSRHLFRANRASKTSAFGVSSSSMMASPHTADDADGFNDADLCCTSAATATAATEVRAPNIGLSSNGLMPVPGGVASDDESDDEADDDDDDICSAAATVAAAAIDAAAAAFVDVDDVPTAGGKCGAWMCPMFMLDDCAGWIC